MTTKPTPISAGSPRVTVEGLTQLRAALKSATGRAPREMTAALKKAGVPIQQRAQARMPQRSGRLAKGLKISARATMAAFVSSVAYAGGSEWGMFGKWTGWARAHGPPPRFIYPELEADATGLSERIADELRQVLTAYGWFHGSV